MREPLVPGTAALRNYVDNIGASDQWVMSYLGKGAFGGEAMAAYKKFLAGEQLIEI
jgi:hypothetical protein